MAAPVASEVKPEFEEAHKEHASVARGVDIKEAGELPTVSSDLQGERQPFLKRLFAPKKRPSYLLRSKVAEMEKLYGHNPELQALVTAARPSCRIALSLLTSSQASILIDEVDTLSDSTAAFCSQGVTPLANAYTTLAESSLKLSKRPLAKGAQVERLAMHAKFSKQASLCPTKWRAMPCSDLGTCSHSQRLLASWRKRSAPWRARSRRSRARPHLR